MPRITFIEDVTLPNEPEGTGPHYRRGYSPDVPEDQARKWIKAGVAVAGVAELTPQKAQPEASPAPVFPKKKRWRAHQ